MNETKVVYARAPDARAAAEELTQQIGFVPDALIVFASPRYDQVALLQAVKQLCNP